MVNLIDMDSSTQPVKTAVCCLLWLWRSSVKSERTTLNYVIMMSSGLTQLGLGHWKFLRKVCETKGAWHLKGAGVYQAKTVE